jgi:hypothetical protein
MIMRPVPIRPHWIASGLPERNPTFWTISSAGRLASSGVARSWAYWYDKVGA